MSDFDKEAEREKLREKYERDREKREATQRMSDLLLKGATMTNRHCDACGDPIFRHEGQEFCPTCQAGVDGDGNASGNDAETPQSSDAEPPQSSDAGAAPANGVGEPADATPRTDAEPAGATDAGGRSSAGDGSADASTVDRSPPRESNPGRRGDSPDGRTRPGLGRDGTPSTGAGPGGEPGDVADISAARASLARSVERFARGAESTDDPRRARDLLAAAREAAEALGALDRR